MQPVRVTAWTTPSVVGWLAAGLPGATAGGVACVTAAMGVVGAIAIAPVVAPPNPAAKTTKVAPELCDRGGPGDYTVSSR